MFRTLIRVAALLISSSVASGQDVVVTTANDAVDVDWQTATIADLPGPDGKVSFSEALIAANHTPGHQTIGFAIPQSEWILQFILPGRAVLTTLTGFFLHADEAVTIDGTTQTAFTGDTNADGNEVALYGDELFLNADNCTLIGFDSTAVTATGSNCSIEGNTGTMQITLFGGSGSTVQGNQGGTIKIDRSDANLVIGNTVQRVRVLGFGTSQPAANNVIGGPTSAERNFVSGYGTWSSEGLPSGETIQLADTVGTILENNWIGTTPDGLAQGSLASIFGIRLQSDNQGVTIRNNRIAGILGHGMGPHHAGQLFGWAVHIGGTGSGIALEGNTIGLDSTGAPSLGSVFGIDLGNAFAGNTTGVTIGGPAPGTGNAIAGHLLNGITVGRDMQSARISGNAIYSNGQLGIDLLPQTLGMGATPNDASDADIGGNGLQNFPEILTATVGASQVHITGSLQSLASTEFTVEFFASPDCDGSGFGEGREFIGSSTVVTDVMGSAGFDVTFSVVPAAGGYVTATATLEPAGATSEFSACFATSTGSSSFVRGDSNTDGSFDISDPVFTLGYLFSGGPLGPCASAHDANDDGSLNLADAVIALNALFGAASIPAPHPSCGLDTTADSLDCSGVPGCP